MGEDPLVLLSNRAQIRQFDMVTNTHVPLIQSPGSAVAMDFHMDNQVRESMGGKRYQLNQL